MSRQRLALITLVLVALLAAGCTPEAEPTATPLATRASSEPTQTATKAATVTTEPTSTPIPTTVSEENGPALLEGEPVESWVGYIYSTPPMAQYDDYFENPNGDKYGIEALSNDVNEQMDALRDTGQLVGISGMLVDEQLDVNGVQIIVSLIVPYGEEEISDWTGTLHSTEIGVQFNDYFTLSDNRASVYGTTSFGINSLDDEINAQLDLLRDSDQEFTVSGTLRRLVPDAYGFQIEVTQLLVDDMLWAAHSIEWKTYINEEYGFSIDYPADWQVIEREAGDPGAGFTYAASVEFAGDDARLVIQVREGGSNNIFSYAPGSGDWGSNGSIEIAGTEVLIVPLVSGSTTKAVYYGGTSGFAAGGSEFGISLSSNGTEDYASFDMDPNLITIAERALKTLAVGECGESVVWWGTVSAVEGAENEYFFQHQIYDSYTYPLISASDAITEKLAEIADNGETVHVWAELIDADGQPQLKIKRIEMQISLEAPEIVSSVVEAWEGIVVKTEPGNQYDLYFQRDDNEQFGITADSATSETLEQAAWTGATIRVWGTLNENVPDVQNRQIATDRIDFLEDGATTPRNLSLFATTSASSTLTEGKKTFSPVFAIDGNANSCWVEGAEGSGEGEWLQLDFPGEIRINAINIVNGFTEPKDLYSANARPRVVELIFDSTSVEVVLDDNLSLQNIYLADRNITTQTVRMRIESVYEGTTYEDACLSEFQVWGCVVAE